METNDQELLNQALSKLEHAKVLSASVRLSVAQIALSRNDRPAARRHLDELLRTQPGNVPALEQIIKLDLREGQRDLAERHVESILTVDPGNGLGNYVLGTIQAYHEQYALAESSFRASLAVQTNSLVLNDLGWILYKRGALDEAASLVNHALELDESNPSTWDTLGSILLAKGDLAEAEKALQKALSIRPDHPPFLFNMVLLYEKKGLYRDALKIADTLLAKPTELPRESYGELRDVVRRLRSNI